MLSHVRTLMWRHSWSMNCWLTWTTQHTWQPEKILLNTVHATASGLSCKYIFVTNNDNLVHKLCHYSAVIYLVTASWGSEAHKKGGTKGPKNSYSNFPLILLLWLYYPRRVSATPVSLLHPSLSYATCLQLTIPIFLMSFFTSSLHLALGLPVGCFWCKLAWYIFLVFHHPSRLISMVKLFLALLHRVWCHVSMYCSICTWVFVLHGCYKMYLFLEAFICHIPY